MRAGSAPSGSRNAATLAWVCAAIVAGTLARTASNTRSWANALPRITCAASSSLRASANCIADACKTFSAIATLKSAPAMLATRASVSAPGDSCEMRRSMRRPTDIGRGNAAASATCARRRSTHACFSVSSTNSGFPPVRRARPGARALPSTPGRPRESTSSASDASSSGASTRRSRRASSTSAWCSACTGDAASAGRYASAQRSGLAEAVSRSPSSSISERSISRLASSAKCRSSTMSPARSSWANSRVRIARCMM